MKTDEEYQLKYNIAIMLENKNCRIFGVLKKTRKKKKQRLVCFFLNINSFFFS